MKKAFLFFSAVVVLAASCKKDNNDNKSRKDHLTSGNWFIRGSLTTISAAGVDSTFDSFKDMEACEKDDFMTFNASGAFTIDEGATKCDPEDPQTTSGTWAFIENDTKLVITQDNMSDTSKVVELNGNTLKLENSYDVMGIVFKNTITLGR